MTQRAENGGLDPSWLIFAFLGQGIQSSKTRLCSLKNSPSWLKASNPPRLVLGYLTPRLVLGYLKNLMDVSDIFYLFLLGGGAGGVWGGGDRGGGGLLFY